jgi:hypothetical protein
VQIGYFAPLGAQLTGSLTRVRSIEDALMIASGGIAPAITRNNGSGDEP